MSRPAVDAVVFDIGNVLVEWDPRRLYRKLLPDETAVEWFLANICTPAWNAQFDRGRPFGEGVAALRAQHPEHAALISAYDERWSEMLGGAITGTVAVLGDLQSAGVRCYGLTNFSVEKWAVARRRFPVLERLEGVVVSGRERVAKPDWPIYRRLISRFELRPEATAFTDDAPENVASARALGFQATRFVGPGRLRSDLRNLGLPV